MHKLTRTALAASVAAIAVATGLIAVTQPGATADESTTPVDRQPVQIELFSPSNGDNAGAEGKGWFVDLEIDFAGGANGLRQSAFSGPQLTGPLAHVNTAPFPGLFGPGRDEKVPGLVVLTSTTINNPDKAFFGPGTNLAGLFNLTGVTDRSAEETEIWDTWIVGDSIAGLDVDTTLTVAVVRDLNRDGIANDAPNRIFDFNRDGRIDAADLARLGVASNIVTVNFHINGAPAP